MSQDIGSTLARVATRLNDAGVPYMVVGSVAALLHGRVRSTIDVDLVIDPTPASLDRFLAALGEEQFYLSKEAAHEALSRRSQFNIIDFASGLKIDLIVRKEREFSRAEFQRRRDVAAFGTTFPVATLEDTILAKLEWSKIAGGSNRQLEDVAQLVGLGGDALDADYIERWAGTLDVMEPWRGICAAE